MTRRLTATPPELRAPAADDRPVRLTCRPERATRIAEPPPKGPRRGIVTMSERQRAEWLRGRIREMADGTRTRGEVATALRLVPSHLGQIVAALRKEGHDLRFATPAEEVDKSAAILRMRAEGATYAEIGRALQVSNRVICTAIRGAAQ